MTRVAMISANLGNYDPPNEWPVQEVPSGVSVDVFRYTDANFPPRPKAMTSRLQCGIPKWFGWEMHPGYDAYVWIDGSCAPTPVAAAWFLAALATNEIAAFRHPERESIREEYDFMKERMARPGETYLNSRYGGEWLDQQFEVLGVDSNGDDGLFATTAFVYRDTQNIREAFTRVWLAKTRYLLHDQLAFAAEFVNADFAVEEIQDNYLNCPALTFTRKKR